MLTFCIFTKSIILAKVLSYLKNSGMGVNYCSPSNLLFQLIEYRLDQLNNKHIKIPVNATTQYFESLSQKKMSARSFLIHPPQNGGPVKYFLLCIIWKKSDMPITNLVCEKVGFTIKGQSKMLFLHFCLFPFSKFQITIVKNLMADFEGS